MNSIELDKLPRPSHRRDSDGRVRAAKEVDDILSSLIVLDEKKLLKELPCYVVDNTDNIPTMKLEDGEMKYFAKKLDKLEEALTHLQVCFNRLHNTGEIVPPAADVIKVTKAHDGSSNRPDATASSNTNTTGAKPKSNPWAVRVNHESTDQFSISDMETDNNGEFNEVINSHRKKRRLRQSPQFSSNADKQQPTAVKVNRQQPLVIGRGVIFGQLFVLLLSLSSTKKCFVLIMLIQRSMWMT